MKWFNTLSHNRWLEQETDRIFTFGKHTAVPTGFGWLGNKGQIKEEMGTHLWITARMLHVYSVAASMGRPGAYDLVDHGIKAMNGALRDKKYGGWYACVNDLGVVDASKQGYQHFFALLGAASAVTTGHPEARKLLTPLKLLRNTSGAKKSRCAWSPGMKPSAKPKTTVAATPICMPSKPS